jgi:hypothetical protein
VTDPGAGRGRQVKGRLRAIEAEATGGEHAFGAGSGAHVPGKCVRRRAGRWGVLDVGAWGERPLTQAR